MRREAPGRDSERLLALWAGHAFKVGPLQAGCHFIPTVGAGEAEVTCFQWNFRSTRSLGHFESRMHTKMGGYQPHEYSNVYVIICKWTHYSLDDMMYVYCVRLNKELYDGLHAT